jgi:hypothetical protein
VSGAVWTDRQTFASCRAASIRYQLIPGKHRYCKVSGAVWGHSVLLSGARGSFLGLAGLCDRSCLAGVFTECLSVSPQLKAMGIDDVVGFDFMDAPPRAGIVRALELLYSLGALDAQVGVLHGLCLGFARHRVRLRAHSRNPIYLSVCLSVCLSIYLSIYLCLQLLEGRHLFSLLWGDAN